jgi:hypothetical protein
MTLVVTTVAVRRASRALCSASVWASFVVSSALARAQDNAHRTQPASTLVVAPTAVTKGEPLDPPKADVGAPRNAEQAAAAAYESALTLYGAGNIKGAYERMRESYQLSQRPELLYNLARLERELRACKASLDDYRRYLREVPQGRYREDAEQARGELEQECPTAEALPAPTPTPPRPGPTRAVAEPKQSVPSSASTYWTQPHVLGWSAIVASVLAAGSSIYFTHEAVSARDADQKQADAAPSPAHHDPVLLARQHRDQTWAQVLGVTAGALVAGGVLVLVLDPHGTNRTTAHLGVAPGQFDASLSRSF